MMSQLEDHEVVARLEHLHLWQASRGDDDYFGSLGDDVLRISRGLEAGT